MNSEALEKAGKIIKKLNDDLKDAVEAATKIQ